MRLSGRFRSALIIGLQGIRARKLRTLLSLVSLFLGVLAVVTVQAGAEIAQRATIADVELNSGKDGTHALFLSGDEKTTPVALDVLHGRSDGVALIENQAVIGEPGVTPVNAGGRPFDDVGGGPPAAMVCDPSGDCKPMYGGGGGGDTGAAPVGKAIEVQLIALTGDVRQFRPFRLKSGNWLDFSSQPSLAPRIVLNKEAAKGFGMYRVPAEMRIDGATAHATPRIVGVVDDGASGQPRVYVRADELQNWLPSGTSASGDRYGPGLQILLAPTAGALERNLKNRLVANGMAVEQWHVEVVNVKKDMEDQLALLRWIFLGMASLVLLIGVAGILNVGLATVGERVEEFALRRAVGTSRMLLAGIVLAETLLTGLLTAMAAIGVGVLGLKAVTIALAGRAPFLDGLEFPWQAGVAGVIAGLVAGLLGGFIPAIRAARIPIATVMRA
jgi:putative ABC transport system permease protein